MKRLRFAVSLTAVTALVAVVLLIPLPYYVLATFEVQPMGAKTVYIDEPGELIHTHDRPRSGQFVRKGQLLAQLSNFDLEQQIASVQLELDEVNLQVKELEKRRNLLSRDVFSPEEFIGHFRDLEFQKARINLRLTELNERAGRLRLVTPIDGTVLPMPRRSSDSTDARRLPTWSGSPLSKRNAGAYMEADPQYPYCRIGDPTKLKANIIIDQADIEDVEIEQEVELMLDQSQGQVLTSVISKRGTDEVLYAPPALSNKAGGQLATETDATGREKLLVTSYAASAPLPDLHGTFRLGLRGTAKIHVGNRSLGQRLLRYINQTFNFGL